MEKDSNSGCGWWIIPLVIVEAYLKYFAYLIYYGTNVWKGYYVSTGTTWIDVCLTIDLWIIYITLAPLVVYLLYYYIKCWFSKD